jgi:nitrite reductase/ring-hydroxylating ferredoxin subunit
MRSRYGFGYGRADRINLCLILVYIILGIVNIFVRNAVATYILSAISLAAVAYLIFRIFSTNIPARRAENENFCLLFRAIGGSFKYHFRRIKDIGKARYRKCPHCSATLRLPIRKGNHSVVCPRCRQRFDVRILF